MSPSGRTCSYFFDHGRAQPRSPDDTDAPEIGTSIELQMLAMHAAPLRTTPLMCDFAPIILFDRQQGTTMRTGLTTAALTLIPTAAFAHPAIGDAHGFVAGFAHPLGGLDHILAMVTVGIFAWQLGGRALWLVPATFVLAMAAGGALGMAGIPVPFVEVGIAASVIVLGAVVAFARQAPVAIAVALVGVFAIFHGHAHGTEMPLDATGGAYAAGFMLATAILHAAGIALGFAIGRIAHGRAAYQLGGSLIALAGVAILTHLI
jgi:urease accessory protein